MYEVSRLYSIIEITEIGIFHEGQVPVDYTGAKLKVEVAHQVRFMDASGKMSTLVLAAPPAQMMNGNETTVYPITYTRNPDINETFEVNGGYKHVLPQQVKNRADIMKQWVEQDTGSVA